MYKVLIAEDEPIIRKGLIYEMDWLGQGCFVVGEASDGEVGLEMIKELKPDIVITDIRMPFKDGLEMIKEGLTYHAFESIVLTGYGEFNYAQQAISLGVSEYILKPIDFALLRQAIEKVSRKKEMEHQGANHSFYEWIKTDVNQTFSQNTLRAIEYIQQHYFEKITLTKVSTHCNVSTVHLNAKLKEDTNLTFNDLLNRYRIMKAVELIRSGDLLIYEIAETVGFRDYKYFSHVFKKYVGSSPSSFMK